MEDGQFRVLKPVIIGVVMGVPSGTFAFLHAPEWGAAAALVTFIFGFLLGVALFERSLARFFKHVGLGIIFGGMAAFLCFAFSPAMAPVAALALFVVGMLAGFVFSESGVAFLMGLGVFSVLMMGTGYAVGASRGDSGWWVGGLFLLAVLLALYLPIVRTFQRALLASLATVSVGVSGAFLGAGLGAPLLGGMAFLALGCFLSMLLNDDAVIASAFHAFVATLMAALGFIASFYIGSAGVLVPALFSLSLLVSFFLKPSRARTLMLLLVPPELSALAGFLLGGLYGLPGQGMGVGLLAGSVFMVSLYFAADSVVLQANRAVVVRGDQLPRVARMLRPLAGRAGTPVPRLALVQSDVPNLFTAGRTSGRAVIALTGGLLDRLDDDELAAVLAHELFHLKERDLLAPTLASALACFPGGGIRRLLAGREGASRPLLLLAVVLVAPFFALLLQFSVHRAREGRADAGASALVGGTRALASALEILELGAQEAPLDVNPATEPLFAVSPLRGGWLVGLFTTRPPTDERLGALGPAAPGPSGGKADPAGPEAPPAPGPGGPKAQAESAAPGGG